MSQTKSGNMCANNPKNLGASPMKVDDTTNGIYNFRHEIRNDPSDMWVWPVTDGDKYNCPPPVRL